MAKTAKEILLRAAEIIECRGQCKGSLVNYKGECCRLGALMLAADGDDPDEVLAVYQRLRDESQVISLSEVSEDDYMLLIDELQGSAALTFYANYLHNIGNPNTNSDLAYRVFIWNDTGGSNGQPGAAKEFRDAAALLEDPAHE